MRFPGLPPLPRVHAVALALTLSAVISLPTSVFAQNESADGSTTGSTTRRVRLKPVLRPRESTVRLNPVRRGERRPPPSTTVPAQTTKPAEDRKEKPPPPPADQNSPQDGPKPPTPAFVRQPPLPPPLPPGTEPATTALSARAPHRMAAAQALIDKGDIQEAREILFQLALEIHGTPEGAEALLTAAMALNDLDKTKAELREIVRAYPSSAVSRVALSRMGEMSFILGNYEEAISAYRSYRKLAETTEQRWNADLRIGLALLRSEKYTEALEALQAIRFNYPELDQTPELIEAHAEAMMATGQVADAYARYDELERGFPNYESAVKVRLNRGLCAELLGDSATARDQYTLITQEFPGSLEASLAAGRLADLQVPLLAATQDQD